MRWDRSIGLAMGIVVFVGPGVAQAQTDDAFLRALQVLRQEIVRQERSRYTAPPLTNLPPAQAVTFEELEAMYLESKISARQFQQYVLGYGLKRQTSAPKAIPPNETASSQSPSASAPPTAPVAPTNTLATVGTATNMTETASTGDSALDRLAEMEAQMDRILKERVVNEQTAPNQAGPSEGPKTEREILNELLRQLIAGQITPQDYEVKRAKVLEEKK